MLFSLRSELNANRFWESDSKSESEKISGISKWKLREYGYQKMYGLIFSDTLAGKTSSSLESRSGFHSLSSIFTSGHKYRNLNIYSFFSYSVNLVCSVWSVLSWRAQRHVNLCPFFRKLTDKKLMFILLRLQEVRVLNLKTCCTLYSNEVHSKKIIKLQIGD